MRFTTRTSADGVTERSFTLGEVPGVLWTPDAAEPRALILIGHGGGQHKQAPSVVARAVRLAAEYGFAAAAIDAPAHGGRPKSAEHDRIITELRARMAGAGDPLPLLAELHTLLAGQTVPEWRSVLDALGELGPVGYWGMSLGCALGIPLVAAEPRIRAAVLGLSGTSLASAEAASAVTVPVRFLVQWDDERVPREDALALFDALASGEKTLHANPGKHGDVPAFENDDAFRFFARHLG
ncbi:alpha/beta hydrolase [Nonomuraea rhodomycinica]|uniref:Alpha/beta hydrolase n=1 Tax=Nonomuraea rhodomycinica TaxID=1712872 RepID=A0A7Y6IZT3_9ACTN|nr:alpha/beta hydrolase [Nonomuraea rhodomycinica]NUW46943.1 alpha/beta hydrolase [Nonomuraea rhodomycinica]